MQMFAGIENNTLYLQYKNEDLCRRYLELLVSHSCFFSHDHTPVHVHVIGNGGDAKYVWDGGEFVFYEQHGIKTNDLKKIKMMIDENSDLIIRRWNEYFGKEADDDED